MASESGGTGRGVGGGQHLVEPLHPNPQSRKPPLRKSHSHLHTQEGFLGFPPSCGFSRQYFHSRASLQTVKSPSAMQETQV